MIELIKNEHNVCLLNLIQIFDYPQQNEFDLLNVVILSRRISKQSSPSHRIEENKVCSLPPERFFLIATTNSWHNFFCYTPMRLKNHLLYEKFPVSWE